MKYKHSLITGSWNNSIVGSNCMWKEGQKSYIVVSITTPDIFADTEATICSNAREVYVSQVFKLTESFINDGKVLSEHTTGIKW